MILNIAEAYIDYLKKHFKVSSDDELSKKIGVAKSTIASWRKRKSIPEDVYGELHVSEPIDYFKFMYVYVSTVLSQSQAGDQVLFMACMSIGKELSEEESVELAQWISICKRSIFYELARNNDVPLGTENYLTDDTAQSIIVNVLLTGSRRPSVVSGIIRELRHQMEDG